MSMILADLEVLSAPECEKIHAGIYRHRNLWIPRKGLLPFYTLGAASYLDATPLLPAQYAQLALRNNRILASDFQWLHQRVCGMLQEMLGDPVDLLPRLALPGFHIFLAHQAFTEENAASAHWDLQFRQVEWLPEEEPDFRQPLSFTLAIRLPQAGAGLNLWDLTHQDAGQLPETVREEKRRGLPKTYCPYHTGHMLVHSGLYLHQIAPMIGAVEGEERITYQGHALRCAGVWRLYW